MSNYTDTLQRGDKIGCYRIEQVLGRGGFAVTYLATDENLDVEVAIKEYLPREITQRDENLHVSARKKEFAEDYDVGLANFAREGKTLARFKHPHIVRVHQVLHANNTAYMVMDFEQGEELAEILEKRQTLPEEELRAILFPILDGVEEIHRHGFVHRDIKPSNIYVRHNGSPVLIDFGAARYTMTETTQQLTAVVTVGYTPIEQYNVSEDAQGPWSDIYALAAVCYEAVTGDVPTDSVTRASASVTQGDDPLASVRSLTKSTYSDDCLDAIDWGLRMEAEDRPQVIPQWRDSFDGIFNPASAYIAQKDVSIYSPQRVDKPRQAGGDNAPPRAPAGRDDIVSIPLGSDTTMDSGVVSLDPDAVGRDSVVTTMPSINSRTDAKPTGNVGTAPASSHNAGPNPAGPSPAGPSPTGSGAPRNIINRNTTNSGSSIYRSSGSEPAKKRSKLERPSHLVESKGREQKRTIRDEIEFDESDWNYEPPQRSSAWRLLLPALGLVAVVGASVAYVNAPELFTNFGNKGANLTAEQKLDLAEQKIGTSNFLFPAGESAADYYQLVLKDDPNNAEARAGIRSIETEIRQQIADNMKKNNLSEANRLLARADKAGLTGLYSSPETTDTTNEQTTTIADSSPVVTATQDTVITPINTASIEPSSPTAAPTASATPVVTEQPSTVTRPAAPLTGIDNNISPFIQDKVTEINSLIDQQRFAEAKALYIETDKFIPDQSVSRELLRKIDAGEAEIEAAAQAETTQIAESATPVTSDQVQSNQVQTDQAPSEAGNQAQSSLVTATTAQTTNTNQNTENNQTPISEPPRNSYVDGTGPAAEHLDQLRLALEAKDIDAVNALSESLPEGRIRFLNNTFARHHRLDVIIDEVSSNGDTVTGRLNVAMFGRADDGSIYGAGKWNGAVVTATRRNGVWQKIRW